MVLSVLWTILTLFALLAPRGAVHIEKSFFIPGMDKIAHFILFAVWFFLVAMAFRTKQKSMSAQMLFVIFSFIAPSTEVIQIFIEGRSFDWNDLLANMLGLIVGLLIYRRV